MAYSPNVQYEAYKRLDCARARSGFFFFLFFLFDFATLKNVFLLFACLFVFLYKTPSTEAESCGRSESGRTLSSSMEALAGPFRINMLPVGYSHLSAVPSLLPLQFRWSWLSGCGQPRGDARAHTHTLGHTRTHPRTRTHARAHSRTCTHSQMERTPPPLKTCGRGFR